MAAELYVACFLLFFITMSFTFPCSALEACFEKSQQVDSIPSDHLYARKTKPLVLGHHGNPSEYQENTVDGFKSLLKTKADGIEFDTFLTKDQQLVVIHYDNTLKLTEMNHNIWETSYGELKNLTLPKELKYGEKTYQFDKPRQIPLLSEVIDAMKGTGKVMYLNIKPGYPRDLNESAKVGRAVAKLVTDKGVQNEVLIASFDPFKILAVKKQNPSLVVGIFYHTGMWGEQTANKMKDVMGGLPGMKDCVMEAPNGTEFMDFLFTNGTMLKSTNATFVVMDYNIYNNPKFSNNTFKTFQDNYSPKLSFGAFIIDNLALTDAKRKEDEKILDMLLDNNVQCLVTDNVPRLLTKLGRTAGHQTSAATPSVYPVFLVIGALPLLAWLLR